MSIHITNGTATVDIDSIGGRRPAGSSSTVDDYAVEDLIEVTRRALHAVGGDLAEHYLARIGDPGTQMPQAAPDRAPVVVRAGLATTLGENPVPVTITHIEADGPGYRISAVPR